MSSPDSQLAQVLEPSETLRPIAFQSAVGKGSKFIIPPEASRKYFDYTRLVTILQDVLPSTSEHERAECRRLANAIRNQGYLSVFLILREIEKADHIEKVLKKPLLLDTRLPFENPRHFPHGVSLNEFRALQHSFVAPVFHRNMDVEFLPEQVLPIEEKVAIANSGSENIFRIKVHPEFDQLQEVPDVRVDI